MDRSIRVSYVLAVFAIVGLVAFVLVLGIHEDTADREETYYVVGYHWGYAVFDANGTEHDRIEVLRGTELTIVAVNDHAHEAIEKLPEKVGETIKDIDWRERTIQRVEDGEIVPPEHSTIIEEYEAAHDAAHGHDNGHDDHDDNHGGAHDEHDQGHDAACGTEMDHTLVIGAYGADMCLDHGAEEPSEETFKVDESGTFSFICMNQCGYGHPFHQKELLHVR